MKVWIRPTAESPIKDKTPIQRAPVDAREAVNQGDYEMCEGDLKGVDDPEEVARIADASKKRRTGKVRAVESTNVELTAQVRALQDEIRKLKGEPPVEESSTYLRHGDGPTTPEDKGTPGAGDNAPEGAPPEGTAPANSGDEIPSVPARPSATTGKPAAQPVKKS